MLELAMIVCAVISLMKIAEFDDLTTWVWGLIAVAACAGALMIPLPLIRIFVAWVLVLIGMFTYRATHTSVG